MNLVQMISELRIELRRIEEAILVIERLGAFGGKRRGRPPKWLTQVQTDATTSSGKKKHVFSASTRKKMAAAQRRRWDKVRANAT
jgi:hypothetical protein